MLRSTATSNATGRKHNPMSDLQAETKSALSDAKVCCCARFARAVWPKMTRGIRLFKG
jgi:hypothetical protein